MIEKRKLSDIHDNYVEVAYDIECMVSMVKMYEEHYIHGEKNEFQDTIRVIKIMSDSIRDKIDRLNSEFEDEMMKNRD